MYPVYLPASNLDFLGGSMRQILCCFDFLQPILKSVPCWKKALSTWCHMRDTFAIFQFPIMHYVPPPPQILHKQLLWNALGRCAYSQEYFTTIVYAKPWGQTECIMGNWKIENERSVLVEHKWSISGRPVRTVNVYQSIPSGASRH